MGEDSERVAAATFLPDRLHGLRALAVGSWASELARRGADVVVIDLADVDDTDADALGGPFDVAACFALLLRAPDPVRALEGVRRVLRPGGRLFQLEPLSVRRRPPSLRALRAAGFEDVRATGVHRRHGPVPSVAVVSRRSLRDTRPERPRDEAIAVSVVVPARDAAARLPDLLDSLDAQTLDRARFEIVVVDNASRDGTGDVAASRGARVMAEPVPGRARARNVGAAVARGGAIAFVDADCVAEPAWLEHLLACLALAPLAAGPVALESGDPPNAVERLERLWRFRQREHLERDGWAASANLGVRRDVFCSLGGFDARFERIGEDVDFCLRAGQAGYPPAFCPDAAVRHPVESSALSVVRRGVAHGWSNLQLARRHPGRAGRAYWRHPMPALRGDWALRRWVDPAVLPAAERRRGLRLARAEYAARVVGSIWAALRGVR